MIFHHHPGFPSHRQRAGHVAAHVFMAIFLGAAFVMVFGYVVMLLWNAIMPSLLSVSHITYWHSVGLLILARILVGGFFRGHHGGHHRHGPFSRHQFEGWWHNVGERSFREFSEKPNPGEHI
jgi:hypothetical protein